MITGDKLETAENIGNSCNIFGPHQYIFRLNTPSLNDTLARVIEINDMTKRIVESLGLVDKFEDEKESGDEEETKGKPKKGKEE